MEIRWTRNALKNLDEEAAYIAHDNLAAARDMITRIKEFVLLLQCHPALGQPGRVPGTRELIVHGTPYIIPYRVHLKTVQILRVFHASRKWPSRF